MTSAKSSRHWQTMTPSPNSGASWTSAKGMWTSSAVKCSRSNRSPNKEAHRPLPWVHQLLLSLGVFVWLAASIRAVSAVLQSMSRTESPGT